MFERIQPSFNKLAAKIAARNDNKTKTFQINLLPVFPPDYPFLNT